MNSVEDWEEEVWGREKWEREMQRELEEYLYYQRLEDIARKEAQKFIGKCEDESACSVIISESRPLSTNDARERNKGEEYMSEINGLAVGAFAFLIRPTETVAGMIFVGETAHDLMKTNFIWEKGDVHIVITVLENNVMLDNFVTFQVVLRSDGSAVKY